MTKVSAAGGGGSRWARRCMTSAVYLALRAWLTCRRRSSPMLGPPAQASGRCRPLAIGRKSTGWLGFRWPGRRTRTPAQRIWLSASTTRRPQERVVHVSKRHRLFTGPMDDTRTRGIVHQSSARRRCNHVSAQRQLPTRTLAWSAGAPRRKCSRHSRRTRTGAGLVFGNVDVVEFARPDGEAAWRRPL